MGSPLRIPVQHGDCSVHCAHATLHSRKPAPNMCGMLSARCRMQWQAHGDLILPLPDGVGARPGSQGSPAAHQQVVLDNLVAA